MKLNEVEKNASFYLGIHFFCRYTLRGGNVCYIIYIIEKLKKKQYKRFSREDFRSN